MNGMLNTWRGVVYPGDNYDKLSDYIKPIFVPPDTNGLVGAYYPAMLSKKGALYNHWTKQNSITAINKPFLFDTFARCSADNCFDLNIKTGNNTVMFVIARAPALGASATDRGLALSDWTDASSPKGAAIELRRAADRIQCVGYLSRDVGGGVIREDSSTIELLASSGADLDGFNIYLLAYNSGSWAGTGAYRPNTKDFPIAAMLSGTLAPTGRNLRLGGHYPATTPDTLAGWTDVAGCLIYEGRTDAFYKTVGDYLYYTAMPQLGIR
ncbi:hypothetical protein [Serratia entomophila]|uniref:hypothetical protein n=1 Tax=Serratia entomophila TaxID=42906 RepID=UPI001F45B969|nr:hypothetical protein [Serratia entomophila]UIW19505.1 hypothetical protein KHA73_06025 [Serratia entomophila]CAI0691182.1 Uncharacterised protein [Serratia entomophila]CAI0801319.1 Uncharacterised protein [Serratia entomophila]CAI0873219.1 Uncharacterised protein [Serratia entomophila]CAI0883096.1 Uncharacterised protein [Serratia entomophila]